MGETKSDDKYERILELLEKLKVLAEATDMKVGVLHAEEERNQVERRQKEEQEEKKEARRRRDEEAQRQAVSEIKAEEATRKQKRIDEVLVLDYTIGP
jgi:hypothetical protein